MNPSLLSRKTLSSLGGQFNESAADNSLEFGRRMLAKFGWRDGEPNYDGQGFGEPD